ncbi:hypothetical protein BH20VER1_BH20VER1_18110 [soil metagenome]
MNLVPRLLSFAAVAALVPVQLAFAQSPAKTTASPSPAAPAAATTSSPAAASASTEAAARTDLYHVTFHKAALGKAAEMMEDLKKQDPKAKMQGHRVVFRHQEGDAWDFFVVEHLGTSTTIEATREAPPMASRNLGDWHEDTIVSGPSWAEFSRAIGIGEGKKSEGDVYSVTVYRPAPGQREALEKFLSEAPAANDVTAGNVLMQHMEGGAWTFLSIAHYKSWQDYAKNKTNQVASSGKPDDGWNQLRSHISYHSDTLVDRVSP